MRKLPDGWKTYRLGDIASVQTGLAKGKKINDDAVCLPYLRVANVQDGYVDLSELKTIDISRSDVERYSLKHGDVLFTEGGDFDKLGRGCVWTGQVEVCLHQNHVFAVRPNASMITPRYLSAVSSGPLGKRYFRWCAKQTTNLASINSTQLKEFELLVPPIPEQHAITDVLSIWDRGIEQTSRLIEVKKTFKKGLMQQLLTGKWRFPEFRGQEWVTRKLSHVFTTYSKSNSDNAVQTVLSCTKIAGIISQEQRFGKRLASANIARYKVVKRGDLVYDPMLLWDASIGFVNDFDIGVVSPAYSTFHFQQDAGCKRFIEHFLYTHVMRERYKFISQGTNVRRRKAPDKAFLETKVLVPESIEEQRRIADVLDVITKEIGLLEKQLEALRQQKKGLMQKLLTGQVRVRV
jgi:type I restriction enzyme S subunit